MGDNNSMTTLTSREARAMKVLERYEGGESVASLAGELGVSTVTIYTDLKWARAHLGREVEQKVEVPVQPIIDYMKDRGGEDYLSHFFPGTEIEVDRNSGTGKEPNWVISIEREPEVETLFYRTRSRLTASKARGWIDLYQADEICCDVLKVHPIEVYGMAWFDFGNEDEDTNETEEVAAA